MYEERNITKEIFSNYELQENYFICNTKVKKKLIFIQRSRKKLVKFPTKISLNFTIIGIIIVLPISKHIVK